MKKLLIIAVAVLFVLPITAMAQDQLPRNTYVDTTDPGGVALGLATWAGPYDSTDVINQVVKDGDTVWIGVENHHIIVNLKTLTVVVTGGAGLVVDSVIGYVGGAAYGASMVEDSIAGADLVITAQIFPQPDWEVIVLTNNTGGPITIASINAKSECHLVPSMTGYGLGILALLLIGSTVWVLRRRRVGSVA